MVATLACIAGCSSGDLPHASISFVRNGREVRRVTLEELARYAPPRVVATDDPYYHRRKRFRAVPLDPAMEHAFGLSQEALRRASFVLRAADGYAVPIAGERLIHAGAFIAFEDVDVPGFEPIGPQRVSPGPFYLVWTRPEQSNLETHPRPWQLDAIEMASLDALFVHTVPRGESSSSPAMRGYALFRDRCLRCHAINREGGRVGPDLNVPMSIVEYRPEDQIRAYIRDPSTFRYGAMPSHEDLSDDDLDALIAYFRAMSAQKYDPERRPR